MNAIIPIPKCDVAIRLATMDDLPFMDALQRRHTKQLGYFPTGQFEGYIRMNAVLVAEASGAPVGYVISRDRYLKRDELGVIYQLCVAAGAQRKLVGAALVKEVFARSAYGCRLYCCWCAQDLDANRFWESLGFLPIAFRAGSTGKKRVHIFWQKRIVDCDNETKWWYPFQTSSGAIREDRIVFPIPPGTHWSEVKAVALPRADAPQLGAPEQPRQIRGPRVKAQPLKAQPGPAPGVMRGFQFASAVQAEPVKPHRSKSPKAAPVKIDPKYLAAARELRDRYLEQVNTTPLLPAGKYDVSRMLDGPAASSFDAHHADAATGAEPTRLLSRHRAA